LSAICSARSSYTSGSWSTTDIGSPKTLTERLRILEHQGVLTRTVHAEVPPRVVYALTERGESFRSVLEAMAAWGDADLGLDGQAA
jgi:DNA-binding HxlR family transcriptional regulator